MNPARHNDLTTVRTLMADGAGMKATTAQGQTDLYEAIERTDPQADNLLIVDTLLRAGADPDERDLRRKCTAYLANA